MSFLKPVGQVRTAKDGDIRTISYMVDPDYRGEHLGKKMLYLLEDEVRRELKKAGETKTTLKAEVKKDNEPSLKVFRSLGYAEKEEENCFVFQKEIGVEISKDTTKKQARTPRQASFEILRIVAMLMVLMCHYLDKGWLLKPTTDVLAPQDRIMWVLESIGLCSVNIYVLIGSYFLVDKKFHFSRLAKLWLEVFFYSLLFALVFFALGQVTSSEVFSLYNILFYIFPASSGHYWFATAYLMLLLFSPLLNKAVHALSKKQLGSIIWALIILFSIIPSVCPFQMANDDLGLSVIWFVVVYLIAAYIKLYGFPFVEKRAFAMFVASVALIFLSELAVGMVVKAYPRLDYALGVPRHNNFIFTLLASISLFCFAKNHPIKNNNWFTRFWVRVAGCTFGVYLIHEHLFIRYQWMYFLKFGEGREPIFLHLFVSVIAMFAIGVCIDLVRDLLFRAIGALIEWGLKLYFRMKEAFDYLIAGALATFVNWIVYALFAYLVFTNLILDLTTRVMVSNVIAWVAAVLFAYVTNRTFVFHSEAKGAKAIWKEFGAFVAARIFSFVVELVGMYLMVDVFKINDLISKVVIGVVVIILNYIFSKLFIFKKKKQKA